MNTYIPAYSKAREKGWRKEKISPHTHVNVMSQYRPFGKAFEITAIAKSLAPEEFRRALRLAKPWELRLSDSSIRHLNI